MMLTADKACEGLSEEGQQRIHVREGVRLPRVTLQHGAAGGHVKSGCIDWVHSGALRSLGQIGPGKKIQTLGTNDIQVLV